MEAESLVPVAEAVLEPRSWDSRTLSAMSHSLSPKESSFAFSPRGDESLLRHDPQLHLPGLFSG